MYCGSSADAVGAKHTSGLRFPVSSTRYRSRFVGAPRGDMAKPPPPMAMM